MNDTRKKLIGRKYDSLFIELFDWMEKLKKYIEDLKKELDNLKPK